MPAYPAELPVPVLSALYASTAGTAARTLAFAADWFARSLNDRYEGIAIASRIPRMMMTTRSSMRVKPLSSPARRRFSLSRMFSPSERSKEGVGAADGSHTCVVQEAAYGQAPVTMSAPGPCLFQVA